MKRFWQLAFNRNIVLNAARISCVVGTLLNIINQGDEIWHGRVRWGYLLMNYLVPYAVATYSAVKNEMDRGYK
ncbi:MAG: nitrate/nitrite transporter NrtS [Steroidobacteraceae bacterium]